MTLPTLVTHIAILQHSEIQLPRYIHTFSNLEMLDRDNEVTSIRKLKNVVSLFGAAYAAPNKDTPILL